MNVLGWRRVGSCTITVNGPYEFAASGSYDVMGKSGSFNVSLRLADEDAAATSGPCTVTNGGQTMTGTYTKSGSTISFTSADHTVNAARDSENVILALSGYPKGRIVA
ncbi:MAG TPA: hypothetical protein VEW74_10585 [Candidatus Nitrosotalea sp.]|nr:hypothetical protein [Candidatus Nitrosotalea sp.]